VSVRFTEIIHAFCDNDVEFIVVGNLSAALLGAPVTTHDVDVVHRRTPENVKRVLAALATLRATYRGDPRKLTPDASHLRGPGHQLLLTAAGPLDVLGSLGPGVNYEELLPDTETIRVDGHEVHVLTLERLIRAKEAAGREKDLAVLPTLRRTLAERQRRTIPEE